MLCVSLFPDLGSLALDVADQRVQGTWEVLEAVLVSCKAGYRA